MIHKLIKLKDFYNINSESTLEIFISDNQDTGMETKPALIVVPGGGYGFVSKREGDPVVYKFLGLGYNCFTLTYTINTQKSPLYPQPQLELACAYDFIKTHSKDLYIDENRIFLMGFSAGGHLVGSFSLYYKEYLQTIGSKITAGPTGICLAYPVTASVDTHRGTIESITNNYVPELIKKMDIISNVTKEYPPTFIWSTEDDTCVPISNSYRMIDALQNAGVKEKHYIFKCGDHGLSVATLFTGVNLSKIDPLIPTWPDSCDNFFKNL